MVSDGERPNGRVTAEKIAEWEMRRYPQLRQYLAAGELDELLPVDMLADPAATQRAISHAIELGLLAPGANAPD